ncbi:MAG: ATP-grasp domain-containing protein [Candidatus Thorarchaeota archaeon]|jgi:glutathione synthase/RimK-type ligase-like ATP-grasp enzyme
MMFMIVRTGGGRKYARRIGQELKRIRPSNKWLIPSVSYFPTSFQQRPWLNPQNTLLHARAAYPDGPQWVRNLVDLEHRGYKIINDTKVTRLTSNKLECALHMYNAGLPHPRTWEANRSDTRESLHRLWWDMRSNYAIRKVVVKPYTSMEQGANVRVTDTESEFRRAVHAMPSSKVVVQEYINYTAIYRVVVIGGRALPVTWVDTPTASRWRVSVCLNRNMRCITSPNPELLRVAEQTQAVIGGEINFIDIFRTHSQRWILSEVNTACNLLIHERKAREAGSAYWNIARQIALYLDRAGRSII